MFKKYSVYLLVLLICYTSASVAAQPKKTIVFLSWYQNEGLAFTKQLKKVVEQRMPEVTLKIEPFTQKSFAAIMQARVAGRNVPDIIDLRGRDLPRYAAAGLLMNLTDKPCLNNSSAAVLDSLRYKNQDYTLPYTAFYQGVFYNRQLFQAQGLTVPKTHAELMKVVQKLEEKGITPFATHYQDWMIENLQLQLAMVEVFEKNIKWGNDLYQGKTSFLTSLEWKNVAEWLKEIHEYSWKDSFAVEFAEAATRFAKGEAAMFISGTWNTRILTRNPKFDYGIFPYPGIEPGAKLLYEPEHTFAISARTKYPAETVQILQIIASDSDLAQLCLEKLATDSLLKQIKSPENPATRDILTYVAKNQLVDLSLINFQLKPAYQAEYAKNIAEWLLGKMTLNQALKKTDNFRTKVK